MTVSKYLREERLASEVKQGALVRISGNKVSFMIPQNSSKILSQLRRRPGHVIIRQGETEHFTSRC